MKWRVLTLSLAIASFAVLTGCTSHRHTATFGNYKIVYGEMGPVSQRWETIKAAVSGWEVMGATDDEEYSVMVLHKPK